MMHLLEQSSEVFKCHIFTNKNYVWPDYTLNFDYTIASFFSTSCKLTLTLGPDGAHLREV